MAKSLFYRLFGLGKIPAPLMSELKSEGIVLIDEGVKGSVTYRNFSAPGRRSNWRRQWVTASIVLTNQRLVGLTYSSLAINVPLADDRIHAMNIHQEKGGALCVAFDVSLFHADWSGTIEYRFKTPEASRLVELLQSAASPPDVR
jgi:hypothetical protein